MTKKTALGKIHGRSKRVGLKVLAKPVIFADSQAQLAYGLDTVPVRKVGSTKFIL